MAAPAPTIRELVATLSAETWADVRDALAALGEALQSTPTSDGESEDVSRALFSLARHPKWEVRQEVALAALHVPAEDFDRIIAPLVDDENTWVREAAQRARRRRRATSRASARRDPPTGRLPRRLAEVEARFGPAARAVARRAATEHAHDVMRLEHHEINRVITPLELGISRLQATLAAGAVDRDAFLADLKQVHERVDLLRGIIRSVREWVEEVRLDFAQENLRAMVEEALALVRDRLPEGAEAPEADLAVPATLSVEAARHRLVQALSNLFQNALESYHGQSRPPRVRVVAHGLGGEVQLTIADEGCGMKAVTLADAFEMFATSKPYGTGVGLPLARRIIEDEHGGTIRLTSEEGRGTTAWVTLAVEREGPDE